MPLDFAAFDLHFLLNKTFITSIVLFFCYWICYIVIIRTVKKSQLEVDNKRLIHTRVRSIFLLLVLISSIVLWADKIYSVIISVTAIVAASIIAGKELFLCILGAFYRASIRAFKIGDRIEVSSIKGDIVDFGLFSTELLEVGPGNLTHQYTGRTVTIPNSIFLGHHVVNESYSSDFILHVFEVPIKFEKGWEVHQKLLLEAAKKICSPYSEKAKNYFKKLSQSKHIGVPVLEPSVTVKIVSPEEINLITRITILARIKGKIEQEIITDYLKSITKS